MYDFTCQGPAEEEGAHPELLPLKSGLGNGDHHINRG